jgi:diacylglycerol kinase family enzyme
VHADGMTRELPLYNLLAANTALYAAEFRFDDEDHSADGRLDLHVFTGAADYVRAFVTAWRRHLRHQRGEHVKPPPSLQRVVQIDITLAQPVPSQLDGEEYGCVDRYEVRVLPDALRIRL